MLARFVVNATCAVRSISSLGSLPRASRSHSTSFVYPSFSVYGRGQLTDRQREVVVDVAFDRDLDHAVTTTPAVSAPADFRAGVAQQLLRVLWKTLIAASASACSSGVRNQPGIS